MKAVKFILILTLAACGAKERGDIAAVAAGTIAPAPEKEQLEAPPVAAFMVGTLKAMPACDDATQGYLGYVKVEESFYTCDAGAWAKIDIKGKDGIAGSNGTNGVAGANGSNGVNGVDGSDGSDGLTFSPQTVGKYTGVQIGYLVDVSNNNANAFSYHVAKTNGMRFEMDPSLGTIKTGDFLYAGTNCTGERRIMRGFYTWGNVQVEQRTSKLYRMRNNTSAAFTAASHSLGASCQNAVSNQAAFLVDEITLTGYPYGEMDIQE